MKLEEIEAALKSLAKLVKQNNDTININKKALDEYVDKNKSNEEKFTDAINKLLADPAKKPDESNEDKNKEPEFDVKTGEWK